MKQNIFPAHIREDGTRQSVAEHCKNTARYASEALAGINLGAAGYCAGILHDMGKCKKRFQQYLEDAVIHRKNVKRGSVNHTFAAVKWILEHFHPKVSYERVSAELLAYAAGAHHGLFDCFGVNNRGAKNGLQYRQEHTGIEYEETCLNFFAQCISEDEAKSFFQAACEQLEAVFLRLQNLCEIRPDYEVADAEMFFYFGLLARLLVSAVIHGDRRDTAEFTKNIRFPEWPEEKSRLWNDALQALERYLAGLPHDTSVHLARRKISDICAEFAARYPSGIYQLNVPTGSGKTLSGLRYALIHAKTYHKSRIIFTVPLLSILDQNAEVIRDAVDNDSIILEHHSNIVVEKNENDENVNEMDLLCETWDSPIIITTLVQLLNTLYAGKTSNIRRFHALCNSLIVIDEVQSIPARMLTLFNLAVNFLAKVCNTTIVLCSATQPTLEKVNHSIIGEIKSIVPYNKKLWDSFQRTTIIDMGNFLEEELPVILNRQLDYVNSLLVICNKKSEAEGLFQKIRQDNIFCFHLSADMCMAHRRDELAALQRALNNVQHGGGKLICIATQVIEAGVDIFFERVVRLAAGMDNIVQSAGRCNRNGESDVRATVGIVNCTDETLHHLEDIQRGKDATMALLSAYEKDPKKFRRDLSSDEAISYFYQKMYGSMNIGAQDYPVDDCTLFDLLGRNVKYADTGEAAEYMLHQAFQTAGAYFSVFDTESVDVIVPYKCKETHDTKGKMEYADSADGRTIIEELLKESRTYNKDYKKIRELLRLAKPFTVAVFSWQREKLEEQGALEVLFEGSVYVLADGFYRDHTGLALEAQLLPY